MSAVFCFSVHADPTPCVLPRVLEVFALYGHVPERCHSQRTGRAGEDLVIDVQLGDLSAAEAALVAKRLGRIVNVTNVLYSAKRQQWAAA
ncbi:MAG TPA: hypothetical protein VFG43_13460 [Geminicoccaceae bacterium]|nr:hypothetical protein [Geminicoccaceae bacterium]